MSPDPLLGAGAVGRGGGAWTAEAEDVAASDSSAARAGETSDVSRAKPKSGMRSRRAMGSPLGAPAAEWKIQRLRSALHSGNEVQRETERSGGEFEGVEENGRQPRHCQRRAPRALQ